MHLPFPFSFIFEFKYGIPIIFFVVMVINAIWLRIQVAPYIQKDPSLKNGYHLLIVGLVIAYLLPFSMLVIGLMFGKYNTIYDIMDNQFTSRHDPVIIAAFVVVLIEAIIYFIWVWFFNGAAFIARHPGLLQGWMKYNSPRDVKNLALFVLILAILTPIYNIFLSVPRSFPTK
jgi:hypothetical protein